LSRCGARPHPVPGFWRTSLIIARRQNVVKRAKRFNFALASQVADIRGKDVLRIVA